MKAKITRILFPKPGQAQPDTGYAIVCVHSGDSDYTLKGTIRSPYRGMCLEIPETGLSKDETSYLKNITVMRPENKDEIFGYLLEGLIGNKGDRKSLTEADALSERFGTEILEMLDAKSPALYCAGVRPETVDTLIIEHSRRNAEAFVRQEMKRLGIGAKLASRIMERKGSDSLAYLNADPWNTVFDFDADLETADRIAERLGFDPDCTERTRCGIRLALRRNESAGHTYGYVPDITESALRILGRGTAEEVRMVMAVTDGEGTTARYGERISRRETSEAEKSLARSVLLHLQGGNGGDADTDSLRQRTGVTYNEGQKNAIRTALKGNMTILTGGPGTGKTTTVRGIIAALDGKKVILAAPTGRAAKRMTESTGAEASTLHRLLEYSPEGGFLRNADRALEGDAIIVDEASMLDTRLAAALMEAVPRDMKVILVGDTDQLPSVGAGNVLRDLLDSGLVPVANLTEVYRQAQDSDIVKNAYRVNGGREPELGGHGDFRFFDERTPASIAEAVKELAVAFKDEDVQVLAPVRKGEIGTESLNAMLQQAINPEGPCVPISRDTVIRAGDKVMQMENNYDLDVFNGDTGRVVSVDTAKGSAILSFNGKEYEYSRDDLDQIGLSYCCTIHKSQGSEYRHVVMPVSMQYAGMLQKNLLYTAITRAKQSCMLVGEREAVAAMVRSCKVSMRQTALPALLAKYSEMGERFSECKKKGVRR